MNKSIKFWKDREYKESLSEIEKKELKESPITEITNIEMELASGGYTTPDWTQPTCGPTKKKDKNTCEITTY